MGVQVPPPFSNPDDTFPPGAGVIINGVAYQGSLFGVPLETTDATTIISNSKFAFNKSLFGNGGAIYSVNQEGSVLIVEDTKFFDNSAPNGEGDNIHYREL